MNLHEFVGREAERYRAFRKRHYDTCGNGTKFMIELTSTGIGEAIRVACPTCRTIEDITDVDAW